MHFKAFIIYVIPHLNLNFVGLCSPKSFDKKYHLLEEKFQTLELATEI